MKTRLHHLPRTRAFTLLEVVVVLAITAMVISAVYTIAQGTLILADDIHRAARRDTRRQAFITFCEHLFTSLPAYSSLNLTTTQASGQYLTRLELQNVSSPFNGAPYCIVTLFTESLPGGGLRMKLSCQPIGSPKEETSVVLFDDLALCEWRVFAPSSPTQQWATLWKEEVDPNAQPIARTHPPLIEFTLEQAGEDKHRQVFWIAPAAPVMSLQVPQPVIQPPVGQQPASLTAPQPNLR
jgi:prepilin-type N-terminal cleavage/methylation domain-containing protein